jgi:hypothetical protein
MPPPVSPTGGVPGHDALQIYANIGEVMTIVVLTVPSVNYVRRTFFGTYMPLDDSEDGQYKDCDRVADPTSIEAYSDIGPRIMAWISSVIGLVTSLVALWEVTQYQRERGAPDLHVFPFVVDLLSWVCFLSSRTPILLGREG